MKTILNVVVLMILFSFGYLYITEGGPFSTQIKEKVLIGGDFVLQNHKGKEVTQNALLNKYTLIFFGFSRCPHICPTQLGYISSILEEVNNDNLQAFFVTLDPQHDNIETLKDFHEKFDERIQMLTGKKEEIDKMVESYKVYVQEADTPEEMNHSTIVYVMGKNGEYLEHLNVDSDNIEQIIQHLSKI